MVCIDRRERGVDRYAQTRIKEVSDAAERCGETPLATDHFVHLFRPFQADLHSFYPEFLERPRAAFLDQCSVRENINIIPAATYFAEDLEEVFPEERLPPGYVEARRERDFIPPCPCREHVRDFRDGLLYLRQRQLIGLRVFLITVRAPQIALFREVPLDQEIECFAH